MSNRLYRSRDERMIAGIAGGMADRWRLDPALVRIGWVFLGLFTAGFAVVFYLLLAIVMPTQRAEPLPVRAASGQSGVVLGAVLIGVGAYFLMTRLGVPIDIGREWPLLVLGLGMVLLMATARRGSDVADRPG